MLLPVQQLRRAINGRVGYKQRTEMLASRKVRTVMLQLESPSDFLPIFRDQGALIRHSLLHVHALQHSRMSTELRSSWPSDCGLRPFTWPGTATYT
jgi:hypothetical protein